MKRFSWKCPGLVLVACVALWQAAAQPVWAQDFADPDDAPAAAPAPKAPLDSDLPITNPAVLAILEGNLKTPAELLQAVVRLSNLGRADLAQPLLQQLVDAKLDDDALAALAAEVQSPMVMRLSRIEALAPAAPQMADAIFAAADRRNRDHGRLEALLPKLLDADPNVREGTILKLVPGQEDSVKVLLHALATSDSAAESAAYTNALVSLGAVSVEPLMGALAAEEEVFRIQAIIALGLLDARRSAFLLAAPAINDPESDLGRAAQTALRALIGAVPTRAEAAAALNYQVRKYMTGPSPLPADLEGFVTLWHWNPQTKEIESAKYPAADVGIVLAAQLARELSSIDPDNRIYRRMYLTSLLEAAKLRGGFEKPLPTGAGTAHDLALAAGASVMNDVLLYAIEEDHLGAAAAAAEVLGDLGDTALLVDGTGRPVPLVQAVAHSDRRVRFAALTAIMKINPRTPFPGSSYVTDALAFFAVSTGNIRVLIGYPRAADAQSLAGLLMDAGFETDVAYRGRTLIERASRSPDVQLILVHESIEEPAVREVLYELRRQESTGGLPIGIIATFDGLPGAQRLATDFDRTLAFPRAHTREALMQDVERLIRVAGRNLVAGDEARAQAQQALAWIGGLTADARTPYDLRRVTPAVQEALFLPESAEAAAAVMARLASVEGQLSLLDLASMRTIPIAQRRLFATAFARNVERFGILLTTEQIREQYVRYNASETADKGTQQVFGYLLNVLEEPTLKDREAAAKLSE